MKRSRLAALALGVCAVAAVPVLFFMNPSAPPVPVSDEGNLLADPSFSLAPAQDGVWRPNAPSDNGAPGAQVVTTGSGGRGASFVRLRTVDLVQDVFVTPIVGRAYRFAIDVRHSPGADGDASGTVRAQTACAANEEVVSTPFRAGDDWTRVSATVQPIDGQRCSLRVGIVVDKGSVDADNAEFRDAGLLNPSFELGDGNESWAIDAGASASSERADPADGSRSLRVVATKPGVGLRQDVTVDPSSQPILAVAQADVRAVDGSTPLTVSIEYREPCSATVHRSTVTVGAAWERVRVVQPRLAGKAIPPSLIKPDGKGCVGQVAIVAESAGSFEVDATSLELSSYWPPEGDPSYQRVTAKLKAAAATTTG